MLPLIIITVALKFSQLTTNYFNCATSYHKLTGSLSQVGERSELSNVEGVNSGWQ
jgi:hypothetical protein